MPNPEIAPEIVERMVKLVRKMATNNFVRVRMGAGYGNDVAIQFDEARAIAAELPEPVDPDLLLAREVVAGCRHFGLRLAEIERGDWDAAPEVVASLAAIKRVRAERQPVRATTLQVER